MDATADARIATGQISTASADGTNAATVGEHGPADRYRASICMWLARGYMNDLAAFFAGDENRFGRMVVDGGKGLRTANPVDWARMASSNMDEPLVATLYSDEVAQYRTQLVEWKLVK